MLGERLPAQDINIRVFPPTCSLVAHTSHLRLFLLCFFRSFFLFFKRLSPRRLAGLSPCIFQLSSWPFSWQVLSVQAPYSNDKKKKYRSATKRLQVRNSWNIPRLFNIIFRLLQAVKRRNATTFEFMHTLYTLKRTAKAAMYL